MLKQDFNIATLVAKYITNSLSADEKLELENWKNASEHNRRLFESMCRKENLFNYSLQTKKYNKADGWEQVQKRIRAARRRNIYTIFCQYAAIFLLPLMAGVITFYLTRETDRPERKAIVAQTVSITPGESKAVLTLGDGTVVDLDAQSNRKLEESGMQIQVNQAELAYNKQETEETKEEIVYNQIDIPRGGEYKLRLSDGSLVHLNAMSSLRYPVHFSGKTREVELTGEAFFEVSKDATKPFLVKTAGIDVRVLGTAFNVSAYPDNPYTQTTLVSGSVQMQTKEGGSIELKPSQQAEMDNKSHEIVIRQVDVTLYTSWIEGKIYFKDERLETIMATLERWYDVKIVFANEKIKNMRFGCNLNRYEEINPFLKLLEATGKVKTKVESHTITIY